jgi:hypothetical protein
MFKNLGSNSNPVHIQGTATSYFSAPETELDPKLFSEKTLKGWVRNGILHLLFGFLNTKYRNSNLWTHVWIAGSGVSYQWSAARQPGDLDVLIGVNYIQFRRAHPEFNGLGDVEISRMLNEDFRIHLQPDTQDWNGYEVTFYVNPGATDIRTINPYAAYDLIGDYWTVQPNANQHSPYSRDWEHKAKRDYDMTVEILNRHNNAINELRSAPNTAYQVNAERKIKLAQEQAVSIYDEIHKGRKIAFSQIGSGYADFHNYRWQAGKKSGAVQALRSIKDQRDAQLKQQQKETYGVELPTTSTLIRRSLR